MRKWDRSAERIGPSFASLESIALTVAWFLGFRAVKDPTPPNMGLAQGRITFIEPVRFSRDYTYIHLGIKTDTNAGNPAMYFLVALAAKP